MNTGKLTWSKVRHPEVAVSVVVEAGIDGEAERAAAWIRWYGRAPRDELEGLMREACSVEQTEAPERPKRRCVRGMAKVRIGFNSARTRATPIQARRTESAVM